MGAMKGLVAEIRDAVETLAELAAWEVKFVLAYEPGAGYHWFVVNPWGPEEAEDWTFHALRQGCAPAMEAAVEQLAAAVVKEFPDSAFALSRSTPK